MNEDVRELIVRTLCLLVFILSAGLGSYIITILMSYSLWFLLLFIPEVILLLIEYAFILSKLYDWFE